MFSTVIRSFGPHRLKRLYQIRRWNRDMGNLMNVTPAMQGYFSSNFSLRALVQTSNGSWCMGIKGEMSGTVCVTFTWDMYIVVYSFSLFCCLFIIVTWWYVGCIVWASGGVGVNSIPELELQLNSNSNSGIRIGIEIGGIENGIGIENSGIGTENRNWFFCNCYHSIY